MALFQYRALQADGSIAEGQLEAGGRQEAFRQMEGRGLRPISLSEPRNGKPQKPAGHGQVQKAANSASEGTGAEKTDDKTPTLKLSFGANKISARMLENFTRL